MPAAAAASGARGALGDASGDASFERYLDGEGTHLRPRFESNASNKAMLWEAAQDGRPTQGPPLPTILPSSVYTVDNACEPTVVWCEAQPSRQTEVLESLKNYFGARTPRVIHFETPARFIRWLFAQPRGAVKPWALFICAWRHAKPCALGLAAARTGDLSQLRPDARRSPLPELTGDGTGPVNVAVDTMIILLKEVQRESRVDLWVASGGESVANMNIHVASMDTNLSKLMSLIRHNEEPDRERQVISL